MMCAPTSENARRGPSCERLADDAAVVADGLAARAEQQQRASRAGTARRRGTGARPGSTGRMTSSAPAATSAHGRRVGDRARPPR